MMWEEATLPTSGMELCTNPIEPENKQPLLWDRLVREMTQGNEILYTVLRVVILPIRHLL